MNTGEWNFTTKVDVHCYGIAEHFNMPDLDFDTKSAPFTIEWEIQWEARERGLKGACILINRVFGSVEWEVDLYDFEQDEIDQLKEKTGGVIYGSEYNHYISGSIEFDNPTGWEIIREFEFDKDGACMPSQVDIDFKTKKITVI